MKRFGGWNGIRLQALLAAGIFLFCGLAAVPLRAQAGPAGTRVTRLEMTLDDVVENAREQSLPALIAKHNYLVSYWQFRTYRAQFLPALSLGAELGNYNRSITRLQDAQTGEFHYVNNNYLSNSVNLSLTQNIAFTGGTVSLISALDRMDQFSPFRDLTYNSQPVYVAYNQPLFAYNRLKWERKIEPVRYEQAKRVYLESIEQATLTGVTYFFDLLQALKNLETARQGRENNRQLLEIARERFSLGTLTRDELLQLQHQLLNDDVSVSDCELNLELAMIRLRTFLGFNETVEIVPLMPGYEPDLVLDVAEVLDRAETASSSHLERQIQLLEADAQVARAKAERGLQASVYARFGLTQVGEDIGAAYRNPLEQEVVGLSLSVPILDWGLGRGRVQVAKSQEDVLTMQADQKLIEWRQEVMMKVLQFNLQGNQCRVSGEADRLGRERYETARERFIGGSISVTELNTARTEMDRSALQYIEKVRTFWTSYYELRGISLYDYMRDEEVTEDFDRITGEYE